MLLAQGALGQALAAAEVAVQAGEKLGAGSPIFKLGIVDGIEAALALGEVTRAEEFLGAIEKLAPGEASPFLRAQGLRFRARLSAEDDHITTDERLSAASAIFRDLGTPFWLAVSLLEHGESLATHEQTEEAAPLLAEAREIFERLGARPFLERVAGLANREVMSA